MSGLKADVFLRRCRTLQDVLLAFSWGFYNFERADHSRVFEAAMFRDKMSPTGGGHVFYANIATWDGSIDVDRIAEIVGSEEHLIKDGELMRVWDMSRLTAQTGPVARCSHCGALGVKVFGEILT